MPLLLRIWLWCELVDDDRVGHGADGSRVCWSAGVAVVGAATLAGARGAAAGSVRDQVGGPGQLGGQVGDGAGQALWGERAARVTESRAASRVRVKLTRPGSRPAGTA